MSSLLCMLTAMRLVPCIKGNSQAEVETVGPTDTALTLALPLLAGAACIASFPSCVALLLALHTKCITFTHCQAASGHLMPAQAKTQSRQ